jgi:glycosyltransferase involved in cell wall biosynthesis
MKTILIITPHLPYREVGHAGGKSIYDFIVELKQRGIKVCLVSIALPEETGHFESLRQFCDGTHFVVSVPVFTDTALNSLLTHPLGFFPKVAQGILKHMRIRRLLNSGIRQMMHEHNPDVIQVEYTTMVLYLKRLKNFSGVRVLDLHDLMMKPYSRFWLAETNGIVRFFRFLAFAAIKKVELAFCRAFDVLLVKSEYDRKLLLQQGSFHSYVFPLGVHPQTGIAPSQCREPGSILFVGAMFRKVNEDATMFFIEQVLPRLETKVDSVKFYIVGSSPSEYLRKKATEKVIVTGYVDDLTPYYRRCQMLVAPLFTGGGMLFKVVQAMSFGLPVVSSTVANEGVQARNGCEILIADDAEEFANKISAIMNDRELWQRISSGGHAFVSERYSWDVVMEDYLRNMEVDRQAKST